MASVQVYKLKQFDTLYNLPPPINTIVLIGGRGGAKTYEASKFIAFSATVRKKRCAILRDEKETIRESILNEILQRYDTANETGVLDAYYTRQDTGIKDKRTSEMLVFTKGFRASDNKKRANLKSISDVDIALIEEAEDIRDVEKFDTFADSIRKQGSLIIIILNTPDIGHWILKRFFTMVPTEYDGYYRIVPKEIPGFLCITTSFEDNPYLPKHVVDKYRAYGDPNSHLFNLHYYLTSILGYASSGRKGQVLKKVKPIKLAEYMKLPFKEFYGQDFGTASPAALVGVKFDKNNCYVRLLNYKPMSALDLGKLYSTLNFNNSDKIIADSADPKAIMKLRHGFKKEDLSPEDFEKYPALRNGFYVVPCIKGADSVRSGISLMDGMNLFAVEECTDLWEEINNYIYDQDKNGNYTNEPKDEYNHGIDAWRYVVNDQRGKVRFQITTV